VEHLAIDWGGKESQICVRSADEEIVDSRRVRTADLGTYLARRPPSRVIIESCAQAFSIADQVLALGHEVRVVPSTLAPALGVGERRTKNDRRDAEALSRVSCRVDLPSVHIPSKESRTLKAWCASRDALLRSRTLLINSVRAWLRCDGRAVRATPETLPKRIRVTISDPLPSHIESLLTVLDLLNAQIRVSDRELTRYARQDELCRRLMTVPGIGPITSIRFKATLDDSTRFRNAHAVESYLGLVPGERSSSERQLRLGITKAGAPALRSCLVQAAWSARRCRTTPLMVQWATEVEKRRGKRVAVVALARKLAGILFAIWRDRTEYDPTRA
jgi:transposase